VHYHFSLGVQLASPSVSRSLSTTLQVIGHPGVDLFFLLSGYLIHSAVQSRNFRFTRFLGKRIRRLYPVFIFLFVVYLVLSVVVPERSKLHGSVLSQALYLIASFLFLPGLFDITPFIYVAWSLSYEAAYCLGSPAAFWIFRLRQKGVARRVLVVLSLAVLYLALHHSLRDFRIEALNLRPFAHPRLVLFAGGVLLFELRQTRWLHELLQPPAEWVAIVSIGVHDDSVWRRLVVPVRGETILFA